MNDEPSLADLAAPVATLPGSNQETIPFLPGSVGDVSEESPLAPGDPSQTAAIAVTAADLACSHFWGAPLADHEREALQRDMAAVLRKYEVPDLPLQEEAALLMTAGGIVYRRIAAKRDQVDLNGELSDTAGDRQKGQRQEYASAAHRVAPGSKVSIIDDILA